MLRPSLLNQAVKCPGVAKQIELVDTTTIYTEQGRAKHEILQDMIESLTIVDNYMPMMDAFFAFVDGKLGPYYDTETEFALKSDIIEGTADVLCVGDGEAVINDWKTGTQVKWMLPVMERNLQLRAYTWLTFERFPDVNTIHAMITLVDESPPEMIYMTYQRDSDEILDFPRLIESIRLQGDVLNPGAHCDGCFARSRCPKYAETAGSIAALVTQFESEQLMHTDDDRRRFAVAYSALEKVLDRAKDELKLHLIENGPLDLGNGQTLKITSYEKESCSHGKALEELSAKYYEDVCEAKRNNTKKATITSMRKVKTK
jgi:hypothetical protein